MQPASGRCKNMFLKSKKGEFFCFAMQVLSFRCCDCCRDCSGCESHTSKTRPPTHQFVTNSLPSFSHFLLPPAVVIEA